MATSGFPLWSTTAASNGTADPAVNFAEGMAPSAVNDSNRAAMSSLAKWRDDLYGITSGLSTGGTSTAFTVTTNSTYATAAVMSGAIFTVIPHTTSGAAPTLAVDSLTARALNVSTGVAVPTGALISGTPYFVRYKHASTEFLVIGPSINTLSAVDIIGGTSFTDLALTDTLPAYDVSATSNKRILVSDALKITNALTEDTSPDAAADFTLSYDTSASAAKKVKLANLPAVLPRGYLVGGTLSNGTDATNDINIAPGKFRDSTDTVDLVIATALGKQLDANWAVGGTTGTPLGGRNSAAGIADGTYHAYAVRTAASSAADVYFYKGAAGTDGDASSTYSAMLTALQAESGGSSYVYAQRLGSIVRSTAILAFTQRGDHVEYSSPARDINVATPGTSAITQTLATIPVGIVVHADVTAYQSGAGDVVYLSSLTQTDLAPSASAAPLGTMGSTSGVPSMASKLVWTNTSAQIRARTNDATPTLLGVTNGYYDRRGRDA